jgi:hypothetical protein
LNVPETKAPVLFLVGERSTFLFTLLTASSAFYCAQIA